MFLNLFTKYRDRLSKVLQAVGIIAGVFSAFLSGNFLFVVVIFFFLISFVISFIPVKHKVMSDDIIDTNDVNHDEINSGISEAKRSLVSSLQGKLQVIPVLTEQLQSVIKQTDDAAAGLSEAFFGISRQAKKQLQTVRELFGNLSEQTSGDNSLLQTQDSLKEIQSNFSVLTSYFDKSLEMISEVLKQLSKVDKFASNVDDIGKATNILALNASIEAARTGKAGLGFKVIASEINDLSAKSNKSIKEITEITSNLTSQVNSIKKELELVLQQSKSIGTRTDELLSTATGRIGSTLQEAADKIKVVAGNAENLSKEIGKVVVSIQFQDITRQKIEHVISPLEILGKDMTETFNDFVNTDRKPLNEENSSLTDSLLRQYTMESEREVLKKFMNQNT